MFGCLIKKVLLSLGDRICGAKPCLKSSIAVQLSLNAGGNLRFTPADLKAASTSDGQKLYGLRIVAGGV